MRNARYALALSALLTAAGASAQVITPPAGQAPPPAAPAAPPATPTATKPVPYGPGMKVNLSPDGSKYLRFLLWSQIYTRYNQNNTGTLRAPNKPKDSQVDFGIRRSRMVILAQLNPRFLVYTHLGINNQNNVSGGVNAATDGKKPQLFIHEAVTEYKVNKYLNLGAGLHYYNGISRLSSASTTSMLAMDFPITNFPTIDALDQFARYLGVFAKGRIGKFDYRLSANDPFLNNLPTNANYVVGGVQTGNPLGLGTTSNGINTGTNTAQYNPQNTSHVYQGYFNYNFLEPEANLLPYYQGTYLGTKRVLSVGTGFMYNKDGMFSRPTNSNVTLSSLTPGADLYATVPATRKHDIKLFGADVFYDVPLDTASRTALTVYGVYYRYDFGPNYVRYVGGENPGYGIAQGGNVNIRGNAYPQSGTGNAQYLNAGFLLPQNTLGPKVRLQPYVAYLHSSYEGLRKSNGERAGVNVYDAGVNVLLDGHNAKVTLNYRARPDFTNQAPVPSGAQVNNVKYRPEITLQTQVFL